MKWTSYCFNWNLHEYHVLGQSTSLSNWSSFQDTAQPWPVTSRLTSTILNHPFSCFANISTNQASIHQHGLCQYFLSPYQALHLKKFINSASELFWFTTDSEHFSIHNQSIQCVQYLQLPLHSVTKTCGKLFLKTLVDLFLWKGPSI